MAGRKVLGQAFPIAATLTTLYTVPAAKETVCSTITVANQSATVLDTFRVSVAVAGAADTSAQYLYFDVDIPAKDTFEATLGITLATTDVVRCRSLNGTSSFNLFGSEQGV